MASPVHAPAQDILMARCLRFGWRLLLAVGAAGAALPLLMAAGFLLFFTLPLLPFAIAGIAAGLVRVPSRRAFAVAASPEQRTLAPPLQACATTS